MIVLNEPAKKTRIGMMRPCWDRTDNPHFGKPYAVNLNHAYEKLESIVEQVSVQLDIGCVVEQAGR
jgi:hypothetical protein